MRHLTSPFILALLLLFAILLATATTADAGIVDVDDDEPVNDRSSSVSDTDREDRHRSACEDITMNTAPTTWFYGTNKIHKGLIQSAEKVAFQLNYSMAYHAEHGVDFTCNDARDIIAEAEVSDFMHAFKQLIENGKSVGSKSTEEQGNLQLPSGTAEPLHFDAVMLVEMIEMAEDELVKVIGAKKKDIDLIIKLREMLHSFKDMHTHLKTVYAAMMDTTRDNSKLEKEGGIKGVATERDGSIDYASDREGEREHALASETVECQRVYRAYIADVSTFAQEHEPIGSLFSAAAKYLARVVKKCRVRYPHLKTDSDDDDEL